jgi:uncharacterized protein GlcG (DUF336 family)
MHKLREPVPARRGHQRRRNVLMVSIATAVILVVVLSIFLVGCGNGSQNQMNPQSAVNTTPSGSATVTLTSSDVDSIVHAAAAATSPTTAVIAVVDRVGNVLALYRKPDAPLTVVGNFSIQTSTNDVAIGLARTGTFFSNDHAPLSSRTVRFFSGVHFPPEVSNAPNADLYGIENTNRGCKLSSELETRGIHPSTALGGGPGPGIITGKSDVLDSKPSIVNPGGLPIYKGATLVGGIGVTAVAPEVAEFTAFSGTLVAGFSPVPNPQPAPGAIFLGGVALPAINQITRPPSVGTGTFSGSYVVSPQAGQAAPEGDLVGPHPSVNPNPANGGLSQTEATQILEAAENTANQTRAYIRLPSGSHARMVIAISDLDGNIIALRRMPDTTIFSIDVAATKARNMVYFNGSQRSDADLSQVSVGTAVTSRTIGFGAQPFFPPGIDDSNAGPFFPLFMNDVVNPCSQGLDGGLPNKNNSGIVFFPGGTGLYRNGILIGGLGVSGDGVDQEDYVAAGGAAEFQAPANIRADQIFIRGVRLPYFKFSRNPTN